MKKVILVILLLFSYQSFTAENVNLKLFKAIIANEQKEFEKLLKDKKTNVNAKNKKHVTLLMAAIYKKRTNMAKMLLEHEKIDINIVSKNKLNALTLAASMENSEILEILLERKDLTVDIQDYKGNTALMYLASSDYSTLLEKLLSHKPKISLKNNDGESALIFACKAAKPNHINFLLDNDADPNDSDSQKMSAFMYMIDLMMKKEVLLQYVDQIKNLAQKRNVDHANILHFAIDNSMTALAKILIAKNMDINAKLKNDATPLNIAIYRKNVEIVEELLKNNANPDNLIEKTGRTPLFDAINTKNTKIVSLLLDYNASINHIAKNGTTPLIWAVLTGSEKNVEILLSKNADVLVQDKNNIDALTYTAFSGNEKIFSMLSEQIIWNSIDLSRKQSIYLSAVISNNLEIIKKISDIQENYTDFLNNTITPDTFALKEFIDPNTGKREIEILNLNATEKSLFEPALSSSISQGHYLIFKHLLENNVVIQDIEKNLNMAVSKNVIMDYEEEFEENGYHKIIFKLLSNKIFSTEFIEQILQTSILNGDYLTAHQILERAPKNIIESTDGKGKTLLMLAVLGENIHIVKLIHSRDQSAIDIKDDDTGNTALHFAAQRALTGIALWLISTNANVDPMDDKNRTPLMYAAQNNNFELLEKLLELGANPNQKTTFGHTPIRYAIGRGDNIDFGIISMLINHGANPKEAIKILKGKGIKVPEFILQQ